VRTKFDLSLKNLVILYTIMLDQSVTTIWLKMISQKQKHDLVPIDKKTA